ncbi:hypothetical protein BA896_023125 [Janthinobacterium lividum]|uniref:Uncharacterized protein n=1 Tax=Janthinobacterium lividum TaxID=29581 RepID=A0A1E8PPK4_9BURK|nr:hypothetical protein BA896_023125 [Janthinobacterium lividum]
MRKCKWIDELDMSELRALQENIKQQLKKREQHEINQAREQFLPSRKASACHLRIWLAAACAPRAQ